MRNFPDKSNPRHARARLSSERAALASRNKELLDDASQEHSDQIRRAVSSIGQLGFNENHVPSDEMRNRREQLDEEILAHEVEASLVVAGGPRKTRDSGLDKPISGGGQLNTNPQYPEVREVAPDGSIRSV